MLTRLSRAQKRAILLVTDAVTVLPAIWLAVLLRADPGYQLSGLWPAMIGASLASLVGSVVLGVADIRISAYEQRAAGKSLSLSVLIAAAFLAGAALLAQPMALAVGVLLLACHFAITILVRGLMARALNWAYARGEKRRRLLIYGAGSIGLQALSALRAQAAITPVGFIDDNPSLRGLMIGGVHVYPPLHLEELAARLGVQEVLIARPDLSPADRACLVRRLERAGLRVASLPAFAALAGPNLEQAGSLRGMDRTPPELSVPAQHCYRGLVVMVTGAGGSIGAELAHQILRQRPKRLVLVEASEFALYRVDTVLRPLAEETGLELDLILGSVGDADLMARVMRHAGVEIVLHAAAYKHVPLIELNPAAALSNNVLGTETLARVAAEMGVSRFVLVSTDKAVRPISTMGMSKWIAEQVVQDLSRRHQNLQVAIVRFGNVLGSSGSVLPRFQDQVQNGGPVTVTDPRMERFFMSIEEAVHLVLEAGAMASGPHQGKIFLFDMGQPVRIETLARQVIAAAGYSVRDGNRPDGDIELVFSGARPGEKLSEELSLVGEVSGTNHPRIFVTPDPILSEFEVAQLLRDVRVAVDQGHGLKTPFISVQPEGAMEAVR